MVNRDAVTAFLDRGDTRQPGRRARAVAVCASLLLLATHPAAAQRRDLPTGIDPDEGGQILSMGQPPIWKWYTTFTAGSWGASDPRSFAGYLDFGFFRDIGSPVASALGWSVEGYFGARGDEPIDGGFRGIVGSPFLRLFVGYDYNIGADRGDFLLRFKTPGARRGFLAPGGELQITWLPDRDHTWLIGMSVPINQPWRGITRPRNAHASIKRPKLPAVPYEPEVPALREALITMGDAADWLNRLTVPFMDQGGSRDKAMSEFRALMNDLDAHMDQTSQLYPDGRGSLEEQRIYHQELDRAFSMAATGQSVPFGESNVEGRALSAHARGIVLEEAIYPYNRLLGQTKKKDTVLEFAAVAEGRFRREVAASDVRSDRVDAVQYVFHELVEIIERNRKFTSKAWGDSKLGWIPLQYGLRADEYDTRDELNAIVADAVGKDWTFGNDVWYIQNSQWQWELNESILQAEDYHVLWIHDIASFNTAGAPDQITFIQMVRGYYEALTTRVRDYDETGKLPVFLIAFDQHYYELKKSRLWMNVLEEPLDTSFPFPDEYADWEATLDSAQAELRSAVAASTLLQERARQYGDDWLANRIKVHVSITNPSDPNFWTNQIFPLAGYPDNIMRDHRKIAFYDITEEDPYKGRAIYTGMGIGEHYVGPTWEDRAIMTRGPAILDLKYAARQLFLNQGFSEEEIPYPLKVRDKPADYDAIVQRYVAEERGGYSGMAMELHNQTGYSLKPINVAKATLYSLMPPGSVIVLPDSLWNSTFFASLLVGNCLRGANVLIIAPSLENAPGGEGFPQMSRAQELFARLIDIQQILAEHLAAAGGQLRTGLYDVDFDVADLPAGARAVYDGLEENAWLAELMPFDAAMFPLLRGEEGFFADYKVDYGIEDAKNRKPQLHLKVNYFATAEAWGPLLRLPEFVDLTRGYAEEMAQLETDREAYTNLTEISARLRDDSLRFLEAYVSSLSPDEQDRAAAFLMVGSANQDYRSMFMDGESGFLTSGTGSLSGIWDVLFLAASATWVETLEELEPLLPEFSAFKFWLGRALRTAL